MAIHFAVFDPSMTYPSGLGGRFAKSNWLERPLRWVKCRRRLEKFKLVSDLDPLGTFPKAPAELARNLKN